jgi:hypothetical protein
VGALTLTIATIALLLGASLAGWLLAGVVVALAAINLFLGFCMGCFIYFQLARRGIHPDLPWWPAALRPAAAVLDQQEA